jgi:long-chain acyl-CoA synthetase
MITIKGKPYIPWEYLDTEGWRGKAFSGEWPTLPELLQITAARFGDRPFFTDFTPDKVTRTYKQVLENCMLLASWMIEQGIKKGDRVAVSGKNSSEWTTVYLSALIAGAIIVPIDYGLHDAEIANLLKASSPKLLFIDEEKYDYFAANPSGTAVYSLSPIHSDIYAYSLKPKTRIDKPVQTGENDTVAIMFTSGTTGTPKGVVLTHKNLVSDC